MKSNKSYLKRLKVTRNGKIIARAKGQNHFNAKSRGRAISAKRRRVPFAMSRKAIARFLS